MKQSAHRMISMLLMMTLFFTSVLGLTGCKNTEETKESETLVQMKETEDEEAENPDELVKNLKNIYECEIEMGDDLSMTLYLKIDKKGNFVFSRSTDFSSDEKGLGKVYKNADSEYYFEYSIVNGEKVTLGDYRATFEIGENGEIIFTSPMWFGTTSPSLEKDGKTVYPTFVISKEEETKASEKNTETEKDGNASDFKIGTYGGTYQTTAMGSTLTYSCTLTFSASGTYTYNVQFYIMGEARSESESGTYKQSGTTITMTSNAGAVTTARITTSGLSLTRNLSSFSFSTATVALTYGYTPGLVTNGSGNTSNDANNNGTNSGNQGNTGETEPDIDENVTELIGGTYAVDISWSPMGSYFSPILAINKETMTFSIYNKTAPNVSKGSGTITEKNGVYTLNYDNGNTTIFTFAGGVITFTSPVWFGTASFNSAGDDGVFVPYTARIATVDGNMPDSGNDTETEPEPDNKPEVTYYTLSAGSYEGVHVTMAMGSNVNYNCKLILNADGTYTYQVSFPMMGDTYTQDETGTYTVDKNVLTLTTNTPNSSKDDAGTNTAVITADNVFVLTRYISSMASSKVEVIYRQAQNQTPEAPDQGGSDKDDNGNNDNNSGSNNNGNNEVSTTLASGDYVVDLSWTTMSAYFTPVLSVNVDTMTFNLYNQSVPETSKGSGNITVNENVYTMTYSNGNTTTFTYQNGVITFTSILYYGTASLNRTEDNETFIPFTATKAGSGNNGTGTSYGVASGVYSGTYTANVGIEYNYTLTLNNDGTYSYNVWFNAGGDVADNQEETGTYVISNNTITLTPQTSAINKDTSISGTVTGENTFNLIRHVSSYSNAASEISFTAGKNTAAVTSLEINMADAKTGAPTVIENSETTEIPVETEIEEETEVETEVETEIEEEMEVETEVETEIEEEIEI